jgi:YVTN family beta-propeller protein
MDIAKARIRARVGVAFFLTLISVTSHVFVSTISPAWAGEAWAQVGSDLIAEALGDEAGYSVSLSSDGSHVAISAPFNDGAGNSAGHVRVYEITTGDVWNQVGSDINGESLGDESGHSVSLSSDGSRVAIGARLNDGAGNSAGHVRVYGLSGGNWVQVGSDIDGEAVHDTSGASVSLSSDGSRVAIGAPLNDGAGAYAGHVRVYDLSGGNWVQVGSDIDGEAANDFSGHSMSLSSDGSRVAIGAAFNDGAGTGFGHVRVYGLSDGAWTQVGSDIDGDADVGWGNSVSLNSDGSRVAIGAVFDNGGGSAAGHVRVYDLSGGNWVQVGGDIDGEAANDYSGHSMSLSSDGSHVAIGAPNNTGGGAYAGHVRVYGLTGGNWVQVGSDIDGEAEDYSGNSVSLSSDGSRVAIGAPNNAGGGNWAGHVRVYDLAAVVPMVEAKFSMIDVTTGLPSRINNGRCGTEFDPPEKLGSLVFSPDGKTTYIANGAEVVCVFSVKSSAVLRQIVVGDSPVSVAFSPDGKTAYVANSGSDNISVIDVKTGAVRGTPIVVGDSPVSVVFSKDGKTAYVANSGSDNISVIDVKTGAVRGTPIVVGDSPVSVVFSPDGKTAYVANSGSDNISVIDVKTGAVRGTPIVVGDSPVSVAFSKDGKTLHFLYYEDYVPPPA